MQIHKILKDAAETNEFGNKLAQSLRESFVNSDVKSCLIFLQGELGAGKTSLVRACLRALGVAGAIKSPTYTLLEPYEVILQQHKPSQDSEYGLKIAHLDLYRLLEPEELDYIGGRDLKDNYQLIFVEWPDKAVGYIPQADINIQLNHEDTGRGLYFETELNLHLDELNLR